MSVEQGLPETRAQLRQALVALAVQEREEFLVPAVRGWGECRHRAVQARWELEDLPRWLPDWELVALVGLVGAREWAWE